MVVVRAPRAVLRLSSSSAEVVGVDLRAASASGAAARGCSRLPRQGGRGEGAIPHREQFTDAGSRSRHHGASSCVVRAAVEFWPCDLAGMACMAC